MRTFTLNVETLGQNAAALDLDDGNPYALLLFNGFDEQACVDIPMALVGKQIDPPRRLTRRGKKRK